MIWAMVSIFCLGVNVEMLIVLTMVNIIAIKRRNVK